MSIIGITGSIASGKTTVANLLTRKKYPLFSADKIVSNLYTQKDFLKVIAKKFKLKHNKKIKEQIKKILKKNKKDIYKLEAVTHPWVRKEMKIFLLPLRVLKVLEKAIKVKNFTKHLSVYVIQ